MEVVLQGLDDKEGYQQVHDKLKPYISVYNTHLHQLAYILDT